MGESTAISGTPVYVATPYEHIKGAIILIHEVWGLTDHIKSVADRLADEGYLVYAPDLLSDTGIEEKVTPQLQEDLFNPEKRNEVQPKLRELMAPLQSPEFAETTVSKLETIFEELYNREDVAQNVAVVGFCFGGTYSYNLAVSEPKLLAAVPFYGHSDQSNEELKKIQAPVLAFYGEKDDNLVKNLPDLENRMREAQVEFNYQLYENCGHAFFNDTNRFAYYEPAAKDAWKRMLDFLDSAFQTKG